FRRPIFMTTTSQKIGLPRTFAGAYPANRKGVRRVASSQSGGAARLGVLCSIHSSNFPARAGSLAWRDSGVAMPHRHELAPLGGAFGQGALERLPPRAVLPGLVGLAP